ncbi:unnamed protein product [Darwinula stevensoni]|uniref:Polybromo-1 n=1 Tax=Darwinula stevensoni TaxID=69355 RepID=A0A7R9A0M9_9CRUS|nr:unnamed protein product [Darwinula stevensoni]CAG0881534.1 unnamed protein product [Darwinula stevensoni]
MPKRKRADSPSQGEEEDSSDAASTTVSEQTPVLRKRRRPDAHEICQELLDVIRNHRSEEGKHLCDYFMRAPKRRSFPDYHETISNPIDLSRIQQKLRSDEYESVTSFIDDIELMFNNAKSYYKKQTEEHKAATELSEVFRTAQANLDKDEEPRGRLILNWKKLTKKAAAAAVSGEDASEETESVTSNTTNEAEEEKLENLLEELLVAVMEAVDTEGRNLSVPFQLLPSRKHYPSYYRVIENPVDLKRIAMKIQGKEYASLAEMEKDLQLMVKNACTFNQPGSQIFNDAKTLKKVIQNRRAELEQGKVVGTPGKYSDSDVESEGESGSESEDVDDDSPQIELYDAVANYSQGGYELSEPFQRLPSKRYYPDYWREIKNPMSMHKIKTKIKNGAYGTMSEVAGDFNVMFENAKQYNRPDSRMYKDAVKLQKIMQTKLQELLELEGSLSEEGEDGSRKGKKLTRTQRQALLLKKRLKLLVKSIIDYSDENGRQLIVVFMEKPSRKSYPDYYQVISDPIDMMTIEANVKNDKYKSVQEFVSDCKLMFNNCREYNEEGSVIYQDAVILEKVLMQKVEEMEGNGVEIATPDKTKKMKRKRSSATLQKMWTLYEAIREFTDPKTSRQLSTIFQKLPSRTEYPDYYEVIRHPIDMDKISQRIRNAYYLTLDELLSDLLLMFDNACKFNEPDSQIYKDALTLQRLALQKKLQLSEDESLVPDVRAAIQELLMSLFISIYNHTDEEGRCFSDSLQEVPEYDTMADGTKVRALSLDMIKRFLDKGLYRRLDRFQEDVFAVLERARRLSRTDSQVFEDSIELQSFFLTQRDELSGVLKSSAFRYTKQHLASQVAVLRSEKIPLEQREDEADTQQKQEKEEQIKMETLESTGTEFRINGEVYHVGDYVYIEPREKGMEPHILLIEKLFQEENQLCFYGNCSIPVNQVRGKCWVMYVKDYYKLHPEGFEDKDIYVCESRYSSRNRMFKKLVKWRDHRTPLQDHVKIVQRDVHLEPKRVLSVFKERVEKHKEEIAELEEGEARFSQKSISNVILEVENAMEGCIYYEQYNIPVGHVKLGDCVYVRAENGKQLIAQIDSMWVTEEGMAYFHGPWFVTPPEISNPPSRVFYKQEVFLSSIEDTNPLLAIMGKCSVLDHDHYTTSRPTEIDEGDVYICESMYEEGKQLIKKLKDGLKVYTHSHRVHADEIYYFRRPLQLYKVDIVTGEMYPAHGQQQQHQGPHAHNPHGIHGQEFERMLASGVGTNEESLLDMEDSLDGALAPSVGSTDTLVHTPLSGSLTQPSTPNPQSSAKKVNQPKQPQRKQVTGYIIYSSEIRRSVAEKYPTSSFGEISRIVGNDWRNLPDSTKKEYEERAAKINEENAAAVLLAQQENAYGNTGSPADPTHEVIYDCHWDKCDQQFTDIAELTDHLIAETHGHVFLSFPEPGMSTYSNGGMTITAKPTEPLFVTPPRPNRLLHTEAYIRYIESLSSENKPMSDWDRLLTPSWNLPPEYLNPPDPSRLPTDWLRNGAGNHGNVVNALWALRDFMLQDALCLSKLSKGLEEAEQWLAFTKQFEPDVQILNTALIFFWSIAQEWCIRNGFELVELDPAPSADNDEVEDAEEGLFQGSCGIPRIFQALNAHIWPNLQMKMGGEQKKAESTEGKEEAEAMASIQAHREKEGKFSVSAERSEGSFENLFMNLREMKERCQELPSEERKAYAEKVVLAFWNAMGLPPDDPDLHFSDLDPPT